MNNSEFGAACNVAGVLGRMVSPKYRPMVLPFSQSIMAKKVLDLAKTHEGLWGQRVVKADDTPELATILSDTSKLKVADYMTITVSRESTTNLKVAYELTKEQVAALVGLGIDGFNIKVTAYQVRTGQYSSVTARILRSTFRPEMSGDDDNDLTLGSQIVNDFDITIAATMPSVTNFVNHRFATVLIQPYKQVGAATYTLQEYCMFVSVQIPEPA